MWQKRGPGRGHSPCKGPEVGACQVVCSRNSKKALWLE